MPESPMIQPTDLRPEKLTEFLIQAESDQNLAFLSGWTDSDVALMLESVDLSMRGRIIEAFPLERYWNILNLLQYETAKHLHLFLSEEQVQERLAFLTDADVITFSEFLSQETVDEYLLHQSDASVIHIQQALSYSDHQVGRFALPYFLVANAKNSVGKIKTTLSVQDNLICLVIVLDSNGVVGVVEPALLFHTEASTVLGTLATPTPLVQDNEKIQDVSQLLTLESQQHWFPVLADGKIMGILPLTTLMGVLREVSHRAVVPETVKSEEDLFPPLFVSAKLRAFWLVINLLTAFVASSIVAMFDTVVQHVVALAVLMPVVASMGGIAGSQTLAVALRGITLNHLQNSNLRLLVDKEVKIALLNGMILGIVIAVVVYSIFHSFVLSLIICCAICVNSLAAAVSGTLIPFTLKKLKIDPAIAGSVILTTVTDVTGFLVFLGLGALFLI